MKTYVFLHVSDRLLWKEFNIMPDSYNDGIKDNIIKVNRKELMKILKYNVTESLTIHDDVYKNKLTLEDFMEIYNKLIYIHRILDKKNEFYDISYDILNLQIKN